ncbi:MAG: UTP--glucose-1-phosphate uridylyltransferase [Chlamydiales bacterium]
MTSPSSLPNQPFDEKLFAQQKELIVAPKPSLDPAFTPPQNFVKHVAKEKGERAILEGKVACIVCAGGMGTRLGISGPKGTAKVLGEKTLFQLLCEKAPKGASIAIMTSPQNDRATREFFLRHNHFGLQVEFFVQNELPLMDTNGNWFADKNGKTAMAPDGNGEVLQLLYKSGIYEKWQKRGVEYVNILPIDNPLADPFDPELISLMIEKRVSLSIKAIEKCDCHEHLGLLAEKNGRLYVLEYSEYKQKKLDSWTIGNTGLFAVTMAFIEKVHGATLPLHLAKKKLGEKKVYKFEKFNFDLFAHVNSYAGIISDRKKCFSPLKNATGPNSFETVKKDLLS